MKKIILIMFLLALTGTWANAQNIAGQKGKNEASVNVSYDPAAKVIHISYPDVNMIAHIEIIGKTGQVLYSEDMRENPTSLSITDWYPGIYYVVLHKPIGSFVARIIKT